MTFDTFLNICEFAVGLGIALGIGLGAVYAVEAGIRRQWPAKPPEPKRSYVVQLTDEDGWPFRSYRLTAKEVGRVVAELDRDHAPTK